MIIPRFMLNATVTYKRLKGITGQGKEVYEDLWTRKAYVTTKRIKVNTGVGSTYKVEYKALLEGTDLKEGDMLLIGGENVKINEVLPMLNPRDRYREVIGYGCTL